MGLVDEMAVSLVRENRRLSEPQIRTLDVLDALQTVIAVRAVIDTPPSLTVFASPSLTTTIVLGARHENQSGEAVSYTDFVLLPNGNLILKKEADALTQKSPNVEEEGNEDERTGLKKTTREKEWI